MTDRLICFLSRSFTHYHAIPHFEALYIAVENIVGKREIACNKQFLFFSQCFLLYMSRFFFFFHFKCTFTLSSTYIHFNTLKKKSFRKNIVEKGEFVQNEQFHLFPQCFLCNLYLKIL